MFSTEQFFGTPGIVLQYGTGGDTTLNSATALSSLVLSPPTSWYINYTAGTTNLIKNINVTGQTSSASTFIEGVVITSGTLAGGDAAGIIFVRQPVGTFVTGENIRNATPATIAVARSGVIEIPSAGNPPRFMDLQVLDESINYTTDGTPPTNSAATPASRGIQLIAQQNTRLTGVGEIRKFQIINAVAGSVAVVNIQLRF